MSTEFGKLPDSIIRKQLEAEAETLLRLSQVCQHSGIRGRGIAKLIFENENSIQILRSYCKDEKDPCCATHVMQMYAHSITMKTFFKNISDFCEDQKGIISLFGIDCSDVVTLQCINRISLINIKHVHPLMLNFSFFESFIEDAELFFEDLFYAVEPYFLHHGVDISSIKKPVTWIGADLSDCLMSRRLTNKPSKRSKLFGMLSWAKNWKSLGLNGE